MNNGNDWARYEQPGAPIGEPGQGFPGGPGNMGQGPGQPNQGASADKRTWFERWIESPEAKMFRRRHRHTIVAILVALFLIFMLVNVGFGYTLLAALFLAVAYIVGGWFDGNPRIYRILQRFL